MRGWGVLARMGARCGTVGSCVTTRGAYRCAMRVTRRWTGVSWRVHVRGMGRWEAVWRLVARMRARCGTGRDGAPGLECVCVRGADLGTQVWYVLVRRCVRCGTRSCGRACPDTYGCAVRDAKRWMGVLERVCVRGAGREAAGLVRRVAYVALPWSSALSYVTDYVWCCGMDAVQHSGHSHGTGESGGVGDIEAAAGVAVEHQAQEAEDEGDRQHVTLEVVRRGRDHDAHQQQQRHVP